MEKILMITACLSVVGLVMITGPVSAQSDFVANYDESNIPAYTLPDPLVCNDGTRVTNGKLWKTKRRPEILKMFAEQMYGKTPTRTLKVEYETLEEGAALNGLAHRKQVRIHFKSYGSELSVDVLLYIPANQSGPAPAFLGINFSGNHTIHADSKILLNTNWMRPNKTGIENNRATEASRGNSASRWAVEEIIQRGYALANVYCGDMDPDVDDGFKNGIHPLFYDRGQNKPDAKEWGSIGAWAWGLSRVLDFLETDDAVDAGRVAVIGHSRLGKTALWAGAQDERFAMVISNDSGCGGAALSRRAFGETVGRINTSFPHWFSDNFTRYNKNETALPMDQHMLLALIAPRPLCVASAEEDKWADPHGEFLSVLHADPVYQLLGAPAFPAKRMPQVNKPVRGTMNYHIRTGKHDVTDYDWEQYLNAADRLMK
jgi:hypothetical protein